MMIPIGVQISLDGINYYKLTDHNRQPIGISYDIIENSTRVANGRMRKYVISKKLKVSTEWKDLPTLDANVVDYTSGGHGGAWIKSIYDGNAFNPIYVKLIYATETEVINSFPTGAYTDSFTTSGQVFRAFITSFTYDILKRRIGSSSNTGYDYVNAKIEFTEI